MAKPSESKQDPIESKTEDDPSSKNFIHTKSRSPTYPNTKQKRFNVPDNKVSWSVEWKEYKPPFFTAPNVLNNKLPDASFDDIKSNKVKFNWNKLDSKINRVSHLGKYNIVNGVPVNPMGRTGLSGRGLLWRWGPNHAADPIVTRWKRNDKNEVVKNKKTNKNILQFVCITRGDTGEYAIPGGMVDPGEQLSRTLKREFSEETLNSLKATEKEIKTIKKKVDQFFDPKNKNNIEIYRGYCDDSRNTDNAWLETVAWNFHDDIGDIVGKFELQAGDDAVGVKWMDISSDLKLFASHEMFVRKVAKTRNAHW